MSIIALANHIWESTVFALLASCLTLLLRKNSARIRYSLWLAASLKFLIPFALFLDVGSHLPLHLSLLHGADPALAAQMKRFGPNFAAALPRATDTAFDRPIILIALGILWSMGTLAAAILSFNQWRRVHRALIGSTPSELAFAIPVRFSSTQFEPGIVGILHPVLLLPKDLECRLSAEEMRAVLAHERCHVAWADNFTAMLHMIVQALFWFHPLIWWLGERIVTERERACDERVLAEGHAPHTYAEGILKVCEFYVAHSLRCVSGISGASLQNRIANIMTPRVIEKLDAVRKLVITVAAGATVCVPVAIGVLTSSQTLAQAARPTPESNLVTPDFRDVDIVQVVEAVAMATRKTFIVDPRVHVKVTLSSSTPITPAGMYEALKAILKQYGYIEFPYGDAVKIVPKDSGLRPRLAPDATWNVPYREPTISVKAGIRRQSVGPPVSWNVDDEIWSFQKGTKMEVTSDVSTVRDDGSIVLEGHVRIIFGKTTVETEKAVVARNPDGGTIVSLTKGTLHQL